MDLRVGFNPDKGLRRAKDRYGGKVDKVGLGSGQAAWLALKVLVVPPPISQVVVLPDAVPALQPEGVGALLLKPPKGDTEVLDVAPSTITRAPLCGNMNACPALAMVTTHLTSAPSPRPPGKLPRCVHSTPLTARSALTVWAPTPAEAHRARAAIVAAGNLLNKLRIYNSPDIRNGRITVSTQMKKARATSPIKPPVQVILSSLEKPEDLDSQQKLI